MKIKPFRVIVGADVLCLALTFVAFCAEAILVIKEHEPIEELRGSASSLLAIATIVALVRVTRRGMADPAGTEWTRACWWWLGGVLPMIAVLVMAYCLHHAR